MNSLEKRNYITWPVLFLMAFVTVIGFDDIIYNFQNQGLAVVSSWIILLFIYVIPYEMMVGQLGSTFSEEGGGITSWIRATNGDKIGYFAAWTGWVTALPYIIDVANSVVISFGWMIFGDGSLEDHMSNQMFSILTALIFIGFIFFQHFFKDKALEILSVIGGGAMIIMTILFVLLTFVSLTKGRHIATQPFNLQSFIPKFDLHYLSTFGLLIFAMNGAEEAAPYVVDMKKPKIDFPKAMIVLAVATAFITVLGSFALGVFFDANHLPDDLKMNGSYYAFQAVGEQFGWGKSLMYIFAVTQALYMVAQLAVLLDAGTRIFLSDTTAKYLPKFLTKKNDEGLPINGYILTTIICSFILILAAFLNQINDIFNWLLNLNGIVSPFFTCFLFWAFMMIRKNPEKYPTSDYKFIKNDKMAFIIGVWCFIITFVAAAFGIFPQDVEPGTAKYDYELFLNIFVPIILVLIGLILPLIAKFEHNFLTKKNN